MPARLSGKGRFIEDKTFVSGEGRKKIVEQGEELSSVILHPRAIFIFLISLRRTTLGEDLMLM
jgi:hypothetical protein